MKRSHAFTVIELIFVIVVLGILASVALPKFSGIREQADIAKGKGDVATIRAGIVNERQTWLIKGVSDWIPNGTGTTANGRKMMDNGGLFGGVLTQGFTSSATPGHWSGTGNGTYVYRVGESPNTFTYYDSTEPNASKRGQFLCTSGTECSQLTN